MVSRHEMKGDFAYRCECGKLIKIGDEQKDFFLGRDEGNKMTLLVGTCPECGKDSLFPRDAIGKTVLPL